MSYKTIYTEVEVEVDLDEFDDDELLEEIERRNLSVNASPDEARRLLEDIYYKRVMNKDFTAELDRYFYLTLGRLA
jgi:hypothetical protein